ncbi:type II secretion system F family protein [Flagellimonas allohymeniacidonis]|uniref:Type II secretion system F family protein n=1 Tax=Flagellimonas allohymeniacidonis TaxID=2517819 RepID=A0A4Q8QIH3_9FLAO|nr:type II secretion system F family protein [Allomuricauda hymeniacidonis]TAI48503.1 type II secretion system F family protein [Allomuricauda hymeniacidonis]
MGFKLENIATETSTDVTKGPERSNIWQKEIALFGSTFSNKRKEDFYTELSVLLKAGITLKEALELIQEGQKKEKLQNFIQDMAKSLVLGSSFSDTIKDKKEFTEYEYHSIRIGEESGTLTEITKELGSFFSKKNEQRRSLINALTYPIIILVTAVLVVLFMLRLVVPMFQDIFEQNQVDLPWITKMVVAASDFFTNFGWWLVIGVCILLIVRKQLFKNPRIRGFRDWFLLKIPYLGSFVKAVYMAQLTRAMSLLAASKVPMLNSIELAGKMIDFIPIKEGLDEINKNILQGNSLSKSMMLAGVFDAKMISLIKVAEETNQTEFIFERLNHQYSIEVQQKSKLLSTLLEPMIILFVGFFVGVILVAMYLPMFKLGGVLGA